MNDNLLFCIKIIAILIIIALIILCVLFIVRYLRKRNKENNLPSKNDSTTELDEPQDLTVSFERKLYVFSYPENSGDTPSLVAPANKSFFTHLRTGINNASVSERLEEIANKSRNSLARCQDPQNIKLLKYFGDQQNYLQSHNELAKASFAAILIQNDELYFISVGDCKILLVRNGKTIQLNREHLNSSLLKEAQIVYHENGSEPDEHLSAYLGQFPLQYIDRNVRGITLTTNDTVVLLLNSVQQTLGKEKLYEALQTGPQLLGKLLDEKKSGSDNNFVSIEVRDEKV